MPTKKNIGKIIKRSATGLSDNSPFKYELKGYDEDGLIVINSVQRTKSESDKKKKEYLKRNDVKKVIQKKIKFGLSDKRSNKTKSKKKVGLKDKFNTSLNLTEREYQIEIAKYMLDWGIPIDRINNVLNRYWDKYRLSASNLKTPRQIAIELKNESF